MQFPGLQWKPLDRLYYYFICITYVLLICKIAKIIKLKVYQVKFSVASFIMKNKVKIFLTLKIKSIEALKFMECYSSTKAVLMCKIEFLELITWVIFL